MKLSAELWTEIRDARPRYSVRHKELKIDGAFVRGALRKFGVNCKGRAVYSPELLLSEAIEGAPRHLFEKHRLLDLEIELSCVLDWPDNRLQLESYDQYGVGLLHFESVQGPILSLDLPVSDQALLLRLIERSSKFEIEANLKWRIGTLFDVEHFVLHDAEP